MGSPPRFREARWALGAAAIVFGVIACGEGECHYRSYTKELCISKPPGAGVKDAASDAMDAGNDADSADASSINVPAFQPGTDPGDLSPPRQ